MPSHTGQANQSKLNQKEQLKGECQSAKEQSKVAGTRRLSVLRPQRTTGQIVVGQRAYWLMYGDADPLTPGQGGGITERMQMSARHPRKETRKSVVAYKPVEKVRHISQTPRFKR